MEDKKYQISQKEKMLCAALYARGVKKENTIAIAMVLDSDDQIDDMVWFMKENPHADEKQLVAVAYQLAKEAHKN